MKDYKKIIADALLEKDLGLSYDDIYQTIEIPPDTNMGDYAFPCFKLAKTLKMAPNKIAEDLASKLDSIEGIKDVKVLGPYLNFKIDVKLLAEDLAEEVLSKGNDFGKSSLGQGKKVVVEYSSTNIAKPFHIGHIRSTVIGNVIANIYESLAYDVHRVNYIGDHGTQFGIMIAAFKEFGDRETINKNPIKELLKLYVEYNKLASESEEKMNLARSWFSKLEAKDPEAVEIWEWFKEISLSEFNRIYNMLGIGFDSYNGEAFASQFNDKVRSLLKEKDLLEESEGAHIINLEGDNLPNIIVIKSDGTSTYITRDIATAIYRKETFDFYKNIYVVASEQNLHFQQLFAILKKMGYEWAKDCIHVPFGMLSLKDITLSTRKGQVVFLEDVLNKSVEKTLDIIDKRNPNLENKEQVAKDVGIGAIIFYELSNNKIKDYVFDWDLVLNFDGETGPYVQYTVARTNSIINKAGLGASSQINGDLISSEIERDLLIAIRDFPDKLVQAHDKYEPSILTRNLIDIASKFNKFYNACPILNTEDEELKKARLALVKMTQITLKNGMTILGIKCPEKM